MAPTKQTRNQTSVAPVSVKESAEVKKTVESSDSLDFFKRLGSNESKFKYEPKITPTLPYDFGILTLNQQFITLDTEELILFASEHKLVEKDQVWISDGTRQILTSMLLRTIEGKPEPVKTLTIHWCEKRWVLVTGDDSDLDPVTL